MVLKKIVASNGSSATVEHVTATVEPTVEAPEPKVKESVKIRAGSTQTPVVLPYIYGKIEKVNLPDFYITRIVPGQDGNFDVTISDIEDSNTADYDAYCDLLELFGYKPSPNTPIAVVAYSNDCEIKYQTFPTLAKYGDDTISFIVGNYAKQHYKFDLEFNAVDGTYTINSNGVSVSTKFTATTNSFGTYVYARLNGKAYSHRIPVRIDQDLSPGYIEYAVENNEIHEKITGFFKTSAKFSNMFEDFFRSGSRIPATGIMIKLTNGKYKVEQPENLPFKSNKPVASSSWKVSAVSHDVFVKDSNSGTTLLDDVGTLYCTEATQMTKLAGMGVNECYVHITGPNRNNNFKHPPAHKAITDITPFKGIPAIAKCFERLDNPAIREAASDALNLPMGTDNAVTPW